MPRGRQQSYEVIIPVRIKPDTATGAQAVNNSIEKMARQAAAVAEREEKRTVNAIGRALAAQQRAAQATERMQERATRSAERAAQQRSRIEERAAAAQQRMADREFRDIQRIHSEKIRMAERAAREQTRIADREFREIQRIHNQKLRLTEQEARAKERAAAGGSMLGGTLGGMLAFGGIAGITAGLIAGGRAIIDYSAKLENARIAFTTFLGSVQAADEHLRGLAEFAKTTPFEFGDLVEQSQRMQALGFSARDVIPVLRDIGNTLAATGAITGDRLDRVVLAMSQVRAAGKVMSQDMNQLTNAMIPVWDIMGKHMGKTVGQMRELVKEGQVSSEMFLEAFQQYAQVRFGDMMQKQSRTFLGAMSNITDSLYQTSQVAFKPVYDAITEITVVFADQLAKGKGIDAIVDASAAMLASIGEKIGSGISNAMIGELSSADFSTALKDAIAKAGPQISGIGADTTKGMFGDKTLWSQLFPQRTSLSEAPERYYWPFAGDRSGQSEWQRGTGKAVIGAPTSGALVAQIAGMNADVDAFLKMKGKTPAVPMPPGKEKKGPRIIDEAEKINIRSEVNDLQAYLQSRRMFVRIAVGQADIHNKKGWDHRNAADIKVDPDSAEGQAIIEYLQANNIPFRASRGFEKNAAGVTISTGKHIHMGALSRAFGKGVISRQLGRDPDLMPLTLGGQISMATGAPVQTGGRVSMVDPMAVQVMAAIMSKKVRAGQFPFISTETTGMVGPSGMIQKKTTAEMARQEREDFYFGTMTSRKGLVADTTAPGGVKEIEIFERVGGAYQELIDRRTNLDQEYQDQFRNAVIERQTREMDYITGIGSAEARLAEMKNENANAASVANRRMLAARTEEVTLTENLQTTEDRLANLRKENQTQEFAALRRNNMARSEELELGERLQAAQDRLATSHENAALRAQVAWIEAYEEMGRASADAAESQIRSQMQIADQTVFHADQARAKVLESMAGVKGVTQIWADAFTGAMQTTGDAVGNLIGKVTAKLGPLGNLIQQIATDIAKLAISWIFGKILDSILGGGKGGGTGAGSIASAAGASAGFGGGGSLIDSILGGTFKSGFGGTAFLADSGGPTAIIGGGGGLWGAAKGAGSAAAGAAGKLSLSGIGASIAPMLPLLGLGLGSSLGGPSRAGGLMGGAGGLLLGGAGAVAALGGSGAAIFASGGALSSLGGIAPLLTNPFTIAAAGALLIGAFLIGRSKKRRLEEEKRTSILLDAKSQMTALIAGVNKGQIAPGEAMAQAAQIRAGYLQQVGQLTDKKTRRIAEETVRELDYMINNQLKQAIERGIERENRLGQMSPEFAFGGTVHGSGLIKVRPGEGMLYPGSRAVVTVPGRDLGYDSVHMYAPRGTRVIPNREMREAEGYSEGGTVGNGGGGTPTLIIEAIEIYENEDGTAKAVVRSRHFGDAVVHAVRKGRKDKRL